MLSSARNFGPDQINSEFQKHDARNRLSKERDLTGRGTTIAPSRGLICQLGGLDPGTFDPLKSIAVRRPRFSGLGPNFVQSRHFGRFRACP
jgi:hypothetical protein